MTGGTLTTTSDIRLGNGGDIDTAPASAGGTAIFAQSGGDVVLTGGNVNIGFGDTAVGTYNLSGGTLAINSGTIFAVGNRGNGTVMQSGGSVYVRGPLTGANGAPVPPNNVSLTGPGTGQLNLGRNGALSATNPGIASGSFTLSGGKFTAALLRFGNNVAGAASGSTNVFNLQGTGSLTIGAIFIDNPNASNSFNFTGGILTTATVGMPLTNNGGTLSPASLFFGSAASPPPLTDDGVVTSPVGTTTFTLANSYNQGPTSTLPIDIAGPGSNDFVNIGADPAFVVPSSIAGTINVNLLSGYQPVFGSTFDILSADIVTNTALVTSPAGFSGIFVPSIVAGPDGRQVLRLTVVPESGSFGLFAGAALVLSVRRPRRRGALS